MAAGRIGRAANADRRVRLADVAASAACRFRPPAPFGPIFGRQIGRQKPRAQRAEQLAIQPAAVLKADFELRRMDVHIDGLRRHFDLQHGHRISAGQQQPAIRFAQGMLQRPIADRAAVEKQILHLLIAAALRRIGDVAGQPHVAVAAFDPNQLLGQFRRRTAAAIRSTQSSVGGRS